MKVSDQPIKKGTLLAIFYLSTITLTLVLLKILVSREITILVGVAWFLFSIWHHYRKHLYLVDWHDVDSHEFTGFTVLFFVLGLILAG